MTEDTDWLKIPPSAQNDLDYLDFLGHLRDAVGGVMQMSAIEVPLRVFLSAQEGGALHDLEIHPDQSGAPFLIGRLTVGAHECVLVSESFVGPSVVNDVQEEDRPDVFLTILAGLGTNGLNDEDAIDIDEEGGA